MKTAKEQVGMRYDYNLIAAQATMGSFVGHLINDIFKGEPEILLSKLLNNDKRWICSELAAYCLDEQGEYRGKGILAKPTDTIDPQELFEDEVVFEPWKAEKS